MKKNESADANVVVDVEQNWLEQVMKILFFKLSLPIFI